MRGPAVTVITPGAGLGGQRLDRRLGLAEPVAMRIIPCRIEQHRPGKELCLAETAAPARQGVRVAILGQAPAGIEGLAEDLWAVARIDRLEAQLRGDAIDSD